MSKVEKSDTDQRQFWQMAIETWQSGGLSVRQFCQQEGLSEASFYAWRKKLIKTQLPVIKKEEVKPEPFIQVSIPSGPPVSLELALASGHTLRIPLNADSTFLTSVFSAMKQAKLC